MGRGRFSGRNDPHEYNWKGRKFKNLRDVGLYARGACRRDEHRWKREGPNLEVCVKCQLERTWKDDESLT